MRYNRIVYLRWLAPTLFLGGFLAGVLSTTWQPASAQQQFGKDDVKSVPKSFLEGGDGTYTMLKEIARTSKASADSLARIEKKTGDANARHRDLMKKLDSLDSRLKRLNEIIEDAL